MSSIRSSISVHFPDVLARPDSDRLRKKTVIYPRVAQVKGQGDRRTLLKDLWDESTRSNIAPSSDLEWDPPTTKHPQMLAVPSVGNHTRPSDGMRLQITTRTDSETSSASATPLNTPTSQVSFCYDYSPEGTKRDDAPIFLPPEIMTADKEMERLVIL